MDVIEGTLRRLDGALARLESAMEGAAGSQVAPGEIAALYAERDRLTEEVERLRAQSVEDARLRADAARAVRSALDDLRGAVDGRGHKPEQVQGDG